MKQSYIRLLQDSGFVDVGEDAFGRTLNDVEHFVGAYIPSRRYGEPFDIVIEFCVYSRAFAEATGSLRATFSWLDSQVRFSLDNLDPVLGRHASIRDDRDIEKLCEALPSFIAKKGLPSLDRLASTDDMVKFIEDSLNADGPFMFPFSKDLAKWRVGVWRGEIDPIEQPWVPPKGGPIIVNDLQDFLARYKERGS